MAKKQATIQDIANALNITASTVSRALNDHPKISANTKEQVWTTAKKLNYQPNHIASSLRKGKANTIGMIVPRINRHFFSNVITGVESVLNPAGFNLIICQSDESFQREKQNLKTLITSRVAGILVSLSIETKEVKHLEKVQNSHIPLVLFDRISDEMNVSKVDNDDEFGSYELTKHLLNEGYRSFMWIGGPRNSIIYKNRYNGYKKALKEFKLNDTKFDCFEGTPVLDVAEQYIQEYIKQKELPEVIFAASDYMAMGVIQALQANKIKVPDDVAVAGYSNEPFASLISPKLTTVEQFSEEMGRSAAKLLLEEIESEEDTIIPRKTTLKPRLIIRESTIKKK